jgi:hypothetical protein
LAEDAEDEPPRVVAPFDSYAGMLDAIRARVNELQVTGTALDQYIGLPFGYYSKIAGARPIRRLGLTSFAPIINGLGLKCQFIEDQEATQRLKNRVLLGGIEAAAATSVCQINRLAVRPSQLQAY